ncbi:Alpha/Beta hydrolase protein [Cubamyces lactineus]|nr:Alpha/Beta hydrolase protein [Cubamyces lactineus]
MDPELAAALADVKVARSEAPVGVADARALFEKFVIAPHKAFQEALLPPRDTYTVNDYHVSVEGGEISVRCLVPVVGDDRETFPVLVNIHGGGWCVGNIELDDYALRGWCVRYKISVVNIEYRLAPEYPFPTAVNDCHAALKWTVSNADLLKADFGKGFIVGGHSAGANLSAVIAHIVRDDPSFEGKRLTGQLLREPATCHFAAYPEHFKPKFLSIDENRDTPPITKEKLVQLLGWCNPPPSDPRFSPLLYQSHEGLPRAYIQASQLDILRDDALVYAEALRSAGVEVKTDLYPRVGHGVFYDYPNTAPAARAREGVEEALKWLLSGPEA